LRKRTRSRTEVTIETEELLLAIGQRPTERVWCGACGQEVDALSGAAAEALRGRIRHAAVHWLDVDGRLLACVNSLTPPRKGRDRA